MPNQELSALLALSVPTTDDLLYIVNDPSGTPGSRGITASNLRKFFAPWVNAQDYGVLPGNSAATNSANVIGAVAAAQAAYKPLYFPGGTYQFNAPITINQAGMMVIGDGPWYTVLRQTATDQHLLVFGEDVPFLQGTSGLSFRVKNIRLQGPGLGAGTGYGIYAAEVNGHGDLFFAENVAIQYFDVGIYLDGYAQSGTQGCLISYNRVNLHFAAVNSNVNTINLKDTTVARATETGVIMGSGGGSTVIGGDFGSQPRHIDIEASAQVTLIGNNFEQVLGTGTEFIRVGSNARCNGIGQSFLKGAGNDVPAYNLATFCALSLFSPMYAGFTGALVRKGGTGAVVQIVSADVSLNTPLRVNDADSTTFPPTLLPTRLDNSVPTAGANYRGLLLAAMSRDTANVADRLVYIRRLSDSSYEAVDLLDTKHVYSTTGSGHAAVNQARSCVGRKNFTTAAAASTTISIDVGVFVTLFSATATVYVDVGHKAYAVLTAASAVGGTVTFEVHHPDDTGGGVGWVLHYNIAVSY